jgi:hypothetical protein
MMYRAYPAEEGYDTLRADLHKSLAPDYPGEIFNVEVYAAAQGGNIIYRFDSHYPPTSQLGMMQDRPVGLEYMGEDFRTILLGFPLYYMDTTDAKILMRYVMDHKFTHPTGLPKPFADRPSGRISVYPNPCTSVATVSVTLPAPAIGSVSLLNVQGACVATIFQGEFQAGTNSFIFSPGNLAPGLYQVIVSTGTGIHACKMMLAP